MKILGVKFKNISAMHGEWEIRFDHPPLADTRLFAIVGPNGSGKTTILDALTLALYGETPRLKNPELAIMNWQAQEAYSEVTFAVAGDVYRSCWSLDRAGDSSAAPQMWLASVNGQESVLEDRVIRVREHIAELTGLDFKRFCRSILLAQGEFTAFLTALENERAEILEKIIGPELAQELTETIRSRADAEQDKLLELRETAAGFPLPDKQRLKELRESLDQAREAIEEHDRLLDELEAQEDWYHRLETLTAAERAAAAALAAAEADHARAEADRQHLERARTTLPWRHDMAAIDGLRSAADQARTRFSQLDSDAQTYQERMRELEEQLRDTRLALERARQQLETRGGDMYHAELLDRDIAEANERFLEAVSHYESLERTRKDNLNLQSEIDQQIAEAHDHQLGLQSWLDSHPGDARLETDLPIIEKILVRLGTIRQQVSELQPRETEAASLESRMAKKLDRAEHAVGKAQTKTESLDARKTERDELLTGLLGDHTVASLRDDYRGRKKLLAASKKLIKIQRQYQDQTHGEDPLKALARTKTEQDRLTQALTMEQSYLADLEVAVRWHDTVKRFAPDRSALQPGEPCPLCGAPDHPFVEQGLPDFGNVDSLWQGHQKNIQTLRQQLDALSAKDAELQVRATALEAIHDAWTRACAEAGGIWDIADPNAVSAEIRSRKAAIREQKSRIRASRWHKWRAARLGRALTKVQKRLARKEQDRDQLHEVHGQQLQALAEVRANLQQLRQSEQEARGELARRLEECGEALPRPDLEEELRQRLKGRWVTYRHQHEQHQTAMEQSHNLELRKEALPGEVEQISAEITELGTRIEADQARLVALRTEREGLLGTLDPVRERSELESQIDLRNAERLALKQDIESVRRTLVATQQALPEAEKEALRAQITVEEAEQRLLPQLEADGWESIDTVREHLAFLEQQDTVAARQLAAEQALEAARPPAAAARAALETVRSERMVADPVATVRWKIADGRKQRESLEIDIEDLDRSLQQQHELEREYRELLREIADQEKISAHATAERKALELPDQATTKTRLQRVMLERLIEKTNAHLEVLSSRYNLRAVAAEGFGLEIEDVLHGRGHRSVKSLSGGESFLVSICLALGLSELAGNGRKIESLFLDEGFGTLDDEMLYKMLATLKELRANGKTVGIISHVKRLAEEIPTQIRVEKQPSGFSRIAVVA